MMHLFAVAFGGALGAMGRYGVNALLFPILGQRFPLGTLAVNLTGSLLMGVCYVVIVEKGALSLEWRNLLMVGFLGAFTTFSSFSLETLALWQNGHFAQAAGYVFASIVLCFAGTLAAIYLARLL